MALRDNSDGIWDWNVRTGEVFFSPRWKEMLGYSEDEIGNHLDEWVTRAHSEDLPAARQAVQDHFAKKIPYYVNEHRMRCKDGTYKWVLDRGQALWDAEGNVVRAVGSHTDITERKKAEEALRASEERWQLALRGNRDGIWDREVRTNKVFFSPRWKEILGYAEHEISDRREEWSERIHPDDVAATQQALDDHFAKRTPHYIREHRLLCKNGTYKWVLARGQAQWDETGAPVRIVGSLTDISERKRVEEALQAAEAKYEDLYENAPDMFTSITPDGLTVDCNRTRTVATGHTKEEIIGRHVLELYHPNSREAAGEALKLFQQTGVLHDTELQLLRKDGSALYVSVNASAVRDGEGAILYSRAVVRDITERKQMQQALQASERRYRHLVNHSLGLICTHDLEGHLLSINPAAAEALGYRDDEMIGRSRRELLAPGVRSLFDEYLERVHRRGRIAA